MDPEEITSEGRSRSAGHTPNRFTNRRLIYVLVVLGGMLLGAWLSMPVELSTSEFYTVKTGDSLALLGDELGVARDDLVSWNQMRYPSITEGRLHQGWELTVHRQEKLPRWRKIALTIQESEPYLLAAGRAGAVLERLASDEESEMRDRWRLGAETIFYRCVNPTRMEHGAHPVAYAPELFELAQARAEAYSKIGESSLADYPLCAECVELTEHGMAMCGSLDPAWGNVPFREYEGVGVGFVGAQSLGSARPFSVVIFRAPSP